MEEKELRKKFNRDLKSDPELRERMHRSALKMRINHMDNLLDNLSEGKIKSIVIKDIPNIFHFRKIAREEMITEIIERK